jgi:ADP-ribose pyrophosphatase
MKIPKGSKKVFDGIIFDVYHKKIKIFDGTTQTYEFLKRIPAVSIIAVVDNKIITLKQMQALRRWYPSLPGGMIDPGETPHHAAKRELEEETGYSAAKIKLLAKYNEMSKIDYDDYLFFAEGCHKTGPQHLDGGERIRVELSTFDEFLQMVKKPHVAVPRGLQYEMWEALLNKNKKAKLKKKLGLK